MAGANVRRWGPVSPEPRPSREWQVSTIGCSPLEHYGEAAREPTGVLIDHSVQYAMSVRIMPASHGTLGWIRAAAGGSLTSPECYASPTASCGPAGCLSTACKPLP